jgi:hypothetical protein
MNLQASNDPPPGSTPPAQSSNLAGLGLAALGIVFGDIGTSPLYTLKTILSMTTGTPTRDAYDDIDHRATVYRDARCLGLELDR